MAYFPEIPRIVRAINSLTPRQIRRMIGYVGESDGWGSMMCFIIDLRRDIDSPDVEFLFEAFVHAGSYPHHTLNEFMRDLGHGLATVS